MSFPNIPNDIGEIDLTKEQSINLLLASIGFEELGLSHIINSEAEKIQHVLFNMRPTFDELICINNSVTQTMNEVAKNEFILKTKLENVIELSGFKLFLNIATVTAKYDDETVSASDRAYYYKEV